MSAYYNEIDPAAAAWLRELIARGLIAPGEVDERSITDVQPEELRGFRQHHFFAGIGVWSYALRRAGWPDDRPVWSGSCPCQPYSGAGKGEGGNDPRHLWPAWFRLAREHRPVAIFGEQVEAAIRHGWLDLVSADLEGEGYAIGSAVFGAHSVGAPHIRQRLYFVADSGRKGVEQFARELPGDESEHEVRPALGAHPAAVCRAAGELADAHDDGRGGRRLPSAVGENGSLEPAGPSAARGELDHAERARLEGYERHESNRHEPGRLGALEAGSVAEAGGARGMADDDDEGCRQLGLHRLSENGNPHTGPDVDRRGEDGGLEHAESGGRRERGDEALARNSGYADRADLPHFWANAEWIPCSDGKARPIEPGSFPLAYGAPARVGRLRGYGNAIVAPQAQAFIEAYLSLDR